MSTTKWCIECKKELGGSTTDFLGFTPGGTYCKNSKCKRYGLSTVIYLEEQKKAPENVKSNDVTEENL